MRSCGPAFLDRLLFRRRGVHHDQVHFFVFQQLEGFPGTGLNPLEGNLPLHGLIEPCRQGLHQPQLPRAAGGQGKFLRAGAIHAVKRISRRRQTDASKRSPTTTARNFLIITLLRIAENLVVSDFAILLIRYPLAKK